MELGARWILWDWHAVNIFICLRWMVHAWAVWTCNFGFISDAASKACPVHLASSGAELPVLGCVSWLNGFVAYPITTGDCNQPKERRCMAIPRKWIFSQLIVTATSPQIGEPERTRNSATQRPLPEWQSPRWQPRGSTDFRGSTIDTWWHMAIWKTQLRNSPDSLNILHHK